MVSFVNNKYFRIMGGMVDPSYSGGDRVAVRAVVAIDDLVESE